MARMDDDRFGWNLLPYEREQAHQVAVWKAEAPSVVTRVIGKLLSPVSWLVQKIVPRKAVEGALSACNAVGREWAGKKSILDHASLAGTDSLKDADLRFCDDLADWVHNWAIGVAAAEGAATGAGGILAAPIDIPMLITLALRSIHRIGLCYGFEAKTDNDDQFVLGILAASGANSVEEKTAALAFLRSLEVLIANQTWKKMAEFATHQQFSREGAIISIRTLAKQLGVNITKRRALASIPVIGAVIGATVNGEFIKEVGWAARRAFQERWLMSKYDGGGAAGVSAR